MKFAMTLLAALGCSGCCCNGMEFTDKEPWKLAVLNEIANPQVPALDAGTANVFEIEVSYPRGWSQADEDAAIERVARREVKRLQRLIHAGAPSEDEEPVQLAEPQLAYTVRFVMLNPDASGQGGFAGDDCTACLPEAVAHHAVWVRRSGHAPIELNEMTRSQLLSGVELHGRFSVASPGDATVTVLNAPAEGHATLRLVESCKANVLLVEKKIETSPRKFEDKSWFELRETPCAGDAMTSRKIVGPTFESGGEAPSQRLIELLKQQLDALGIAH